MKKVARISIKEGSEFWKSMQKEQRDVEVIAEEAATLAAERARKEVLDRAATRAAEEKAYRDSIKHYDQLQFKNEELRGRISQSSLRRAELNTQASEEWKRGDHYRQELQNKCSHEMVLEIQTSWQDEYEDYHDGHYKRKCVECYLVEESDYLPGDRRYGYGTNSKKYSKLLNSQVILLRKKEGDQEYELEFDDLKW